MSKVHDCFLRRKIGTRFWNDKFKANFKVKRGKRQSEFVFELDFFVRFWAQISSHLTKEIFFYFIKIFSQKKFFLIFFRKSQIRKNLHLISIKLPTEDFFFSNISRRSFLCQKLSKIFLKTTLLRAEDQKFKKQF